MKYNTYVTDNNLKNIVKQYIVITGHQDVEKLIFLPNGGNFLVFNKGLPYYSRLSTNEIYKVPEGFSVSLKRNKAAMFFLKMILI